MADNVESLIINALIKEQGVVEYINHQKTIAKGTLELTKLVDNLTQRFQVNSEVVKEAIKTYSIAATNTGFVSPIKPEFMQGYEEQLANITRIKAAQDELNARQSTQVDQNRSLVANKAQQLEIEVQLLKTKEQEALAAEKLFQASLKETPQDKAFGSKLEAESKAAIKAENDAIKTQEQNILANKQQQYLIEQELAKTAGQELVANKKQQLEIELALVKAEEQKALATEKLTQAALKETPADRAFGSQLEAESKATIKAENEQIKQQEAAILANKRQQLLIDIEMSKNRVVDVEQARKEAELEDARINKAKQRLSIEQKTSQVFAQYNQQLANITKMIPADQSTTLAKLVPQMAQESGLPINTIMREVQTRFNILPDTIRKATQEIRQFQNGIGGAIKEVFNLNAIMNTAFGVGMAMLIFQLQMMVTKFFQDTIQQAKDLSNAIGKTSIAEQVMSKEGIEVTGKDMLNIVSELKKEFTNVSNADMLKATGDMALRLAGTGFTPDELKGLLEVANAAKIRNPEKTLEEIIGTVSAAAMSGQVEGVRNLGGGLSVAASDVQAYAVRVGMIKDINDKLTEEQKLHARAGVLIEQNNKTLQETLKLQDNLANAGDKLGASWKNFTEQAAPMVDIWNAVLYDLAYILNTVTKLIANWDTYTEQLKASNPFISYIVDSFSRLIALTQLLARVFAPFYAMLQDAARLYEFLSGKKLSEQPSIENLAKQDTSTGPVTPKMTGGTEENADKIKKAINDLLEAMDTFADRARTMEEDFKNAMTKLAEDFNLDRSRFLEDWEIDRQKIIADSEEAMAKKQREYNKKKLDAEAKLQEDLRQLREKYLLNLDDALHERDARQVLRLAREYAMNRQNLLNEFALRQNGDDAGHAQEMADLAKQRDDRLAELDAERALKLKRMDEDYKIRRKRAEAEHKLEMQRLEHEKNDKLRQLATSISEQLNLTDSGARAIQDLYMRYFGPNGNIPNIMKYGYDTTVAYAKGMVNELNAIASKYNQVMTGINGSNSVSANENVSTATTTAIPKTGAPFRAKGGLDIANKATPLIFGEAGPEMALTVPLSQLSSMRGGISSFFGGSGGNSKVEVLLSLDPDLQARIVKQSTEAVASAVVSVRRNR